MFNIIVFIITGIIIIGSSLINIYKFKGEIISHFNFVAITCFLVQVFAPMMWQLNGQTSYMGHEVMAFAPKATLFFLIGYLCFCITYFHLNPSHSNWLAQRSDDNDFSDINIHTLWGAYVICFISYLIYINLRGRSFISQITLGQRGEYFADYMIASNSALWFLMLSLNAMVSISILLLFYQKKQKWISILIYIITLLLTISKGSRHLMLDIAIAPLIVYAVIYKIPIKIWKCIIIVIVSYLLVSGIGAMRGVYRTGVGELHAFNKDESLKAFMYNIEVFFPYYMFVGNGTLYAYGGTYLAGIICLIPRFVFPNKDYILAYLKQNVNYLLLTKGDNYFNTSGVADNYWCEGYKNFGILGIILVFVILAVFISRMRKKIYNPKVSSVVIYSLSITFLFQLLTRSFQNMLMDAFGIFIPILLIRYISSRNIYPKSINKYTIF